MPLQAFPPPGFGGFPSGPGGWQPQQQQQLQPGSGADASASGENGAPHPDPVTVYPDGARVRVVSIIRGLSLTRTACGQPMYRGDTPLTLVLPIMMCFRHAPHGPAAGLLGTSPQCRTCLYAA